MHQNLIIFQIFVNTIEIIRYHIYHLERMDRKDLLERFVSKLLIHFIWAIRILIKSACFILLFELFWLDYLITFQIEWERRIFEQHLNITIYRAFCSIYYRANTKISRLMELFTKENYFIYLWFVGFVIVLRLSKENLCFS